MGDAIWERSTHRRFMVMILIIAICSESIFLIIVRIGDFGDGSDRLEVFWGTILLGRIRRGVL